MRDVPSRGGASKAILGWSTMEQNISSCLRLLIRTIEQKAIEDFSAQGLTLTQAKTLSFLYGRPGKSATQKEMEIFFKVSHPTITGIVQRLERYGLVLSESSKRGRESKQVILTEKGLEICRKNEQTAADYRKVMLKGFSEEEISNLEGILERICKNICCD